MAASRRSPLMRDQWSVDDESRERRHHREQPLRRRKESPASPRRRGDIDAGLKIKGRAVIEPKSDYTEGHDRTATESERRRHNIRDSHRSPRRRARDEEPRSRRETSGGRASGEWNRKRHGGEDLIPKRRKRSRSRSLQRESYEYKQERRKVRSPHQPEVDRDSKYKDNRRDRGNSPARRKYGEHLASAEQPVDSYLPSGRRRSPSPSSRNHRYKDYSSRRRSASQEDRRPKYRPISPPPSKRPRSPTQYYKSEKKPGEPYQSYHSRHRSPPPHRNRKISRSPPRRHTRDFKRERSRSPKRQAVKREASPPRKMQPGFNHGSHPSGHHHMSGEQYPLHGMKAGDMHGPTPRPNRPPHLDTRQQYTTPSQWTPNSSHHGSPQSASPYSQGRGSWSGQHQQYHGPPSANAYSPPYRQNSYPPQPSPQGQYYPSGQQSPYGPGPAPPQGYHNQSYRGGQSNYRGNHYNQGGDRRFSGSGPAPSPSPTGYSHPPATRGRGGHFQNLQWTANSANKPRPTGEQAPSGNVQTSPDAQFRPQMEDEEDNPFRPSKDLQVQDEEEKERKAQEAAKEEAENAKENSKVSFAFKAKPPSSGPTKPAPAPDLLQKSKDPPKRANLFESSKPPPPSKHSEANDYRRDRDDRRHRDDYRESGRRDYREENWSGREPRRERFRERTPEPKFEKKIMKRSKVKRTLSPDSKASTSVYYRKPGNESVVGSGTYGKVFKAIHVYTKNLAALKKIRMDGEKDGFPVTAVREIKLLQSLRHENVVSLQEVMVESNDCYMVFEYLSHDLTGLLNHPTFKLEHAHKKDLSKQLFEGLNYLHRRGVLHRDIKAANILVSNDGQLKLADFGLARFYSKRGKLDYTNRVITIWYRSPELLLGETQYGPAVDIWSAACVMIEIFTRHAIFPGDGGEINQLDKIYNILGTPSRSEWPGIVDMAWFELLRPTERKPSTFVEKYQERVPQAAFELLQLMFQYDPNKRPTASDVLEHPYFTTEEPAPRQATELKDLQGDWHEFESKALRKENERKHQEARRAARNEEHEREKAKRRASMTASDREHKRARPSSSQGGETGSK